MPGFKNYNEKEIERAKKWFKSLQELLNEQSGIRTDVPLTLSRIKISTLKDPLIDSEEIKSHYDLSNPEGQMEMAKEVLQHFPKDYVTYALMPMKGEGEYKNPLSRDDQLMTWAQNNLSQAGSLPDQQIAYLYEMAKDKRLYIESTEDDAEASKDAKLILVSKEDDSKAYITDRIKKMLENAEQINGGTASEAENTGSGMAGLTKEEIDAAQNAITKTNLSASPVNEVNSLVYNILTKETNEAKETHNKAKENEADIAGRENAKLNSMGLRAVNSLRTLSEYAADNPEWFKDEHQIQNLSPYYQSVLFAGKYKTIAEDQLLKDKNNPFTAEKQIFYKNIMSLTKPHSLEELNRQGLICGLKGQVLSGNDSLDYFNNLFENIKEENGFIYNGRNFLKDPQSPAFYGTVNTKKFKACLECIFKEIKTTAALLPQGHKFNEKLYKLDFAVEKFSDLAGKKGNENEFTDKNIIEDLKNANSVYTIIRHNLMDKEKTLSLTETERDQLEASTKLHFLIQAMNSNDFSALDKVYSEKNELMNTALKQNQAFLKQAGDDFNAAIAQLRSGTGEKSEINSKMKLAFSKLIVGKMLADKLDDYKVSDEYPLMWVPGSLLRTYCRQDIYDNLTEIVANSKALQTTMTLLATNEDYQKYLLVENALISDGNFLALNKTGGDVIDDIVFNYKDIEKSVLEEDMPGIEKLVDSPSLIEENFLAGQPVTRLKNLTVSILEIPDEDATTAGRSWMERALPSTAALLDQMQKENIISKDKLTHYHQLLDQYRNRVQEARTSFGLPDQNELARILSQLNDGLAEDIKASTANTVDKFYLQTLSRNLEKGRQLLTGQIQPSLTPEKAFEEMVSRLQKTNRGLLHRKNSQSKEMKKVRDALEKVQDILEQERILEDNASLSITSKEKAEQVLSARKLEACQALEDACRGYLDPTAGKAENERKHIVRDILAQNASIMGRDSEILDSRSAVGKLLNAILSQPSIGKREFKDVISSLKELDNAMDQYYKPQTDGQLPSFEESDRDNLLSLYDKTATAINSFFEAHSNRQSDAFKMMEKASVLIEQDMDQLRSLSYEEKEIRNLPDIIENARIKTVEADIKDLTAIGANSSQRFPLEVDGVNGMFTKEEKVDAMPEFEQALKDLADPKEISNYGEIPESFTNLVSDKNFLEKWLNAGKQIAEKNGLSKDTIMYPGRKGWITVQIGENPEKGKILNEFLKGALNDKLEGLGIDNCIAQFIFAKDPEYFAGSNEVNQFSNSINKELNNIAFFPNEKIRDLSFSVMNYNWNDPGANLGENANTGYPAILGLTSDFIEQFGKKAFSHIITGDNLELDDTERIDSRNSAMSAVAALTGCPGLLARSTSMRLKMPDGKTINGTFMEAAKGMDPGKLETAAADKLNNLNKDGKLKFAPEGLKNLADLQVLDYLCGNIDRHGGNFFYQIEESPLKDGSSVIKGITGIDNDASFGTVLPEKGKGLGCMVGINKMFVISESMANNLMGLSPDLLSFTLRGHHIGSAAIEAAQKRLNDLKKSIKESQKYFARDNVRKIMKEDPSFTQPGKLRIVKDNEWAKIQPERLYDMDNLFYTAGRRIFKGRAKIGKINFQKVKVENTNKITSKNTNKNKETKTNTPKQL